ncbi:hypothetical protein RHGRI_001729 [Rhododendron griersonianum]|uniref:Protein FAR1-RELATED SEQUENCE n=1 Tax=Rhododendron griersonianum TaxID=479676 RepID=A0AAV6LMG8_9ERIC|nr:hypothetical protein RHGRI_001729 [Rhododendron griersonianum]
MAPLSPTPTSFPPPASSTVDPFPPVSPISMASSPPSSPRTATDSSQPASPSPPSSPRTATDSSQPGSPKRMDDGGLEEREIDWSKDYSLGIGMEFDTETAAACIFEYIEEEELVQGWDALVKKYDLNENMWIKKTWGLREKWAHAYLKLSFTAGMRSTQLSESLNAKVKKYVKFDHDIVQFFTHFDRLVMEKREEESDSIYHSREKLQRQKLKKSPILIQVAQLYTPPIFDLFHDEVDTSLACKVKQHHELEGSFKCVIRLHKRAKKRFLVSGNVKLDEFGDNVCLDVRCACRKFENFGILCGHAIKGLDRMGILEIPESYILGRWRLDAKDCASKGSNVSVEEKDPKLIKAARYRNLCPKMVNLGARACHLKVAYDFVNTTVNYMCDTVDKMFLEEGDSIEEGIKELDVIHSNLVQAKGLKRKTAPRKGGARLKPWHEKIGKRRRVASKPTHLSQDVPIPYIPEMINCGSNSQSTPSSSEMKLVNYGLNGSFFGIMDDFILGMQHTADLGLVLEWTSFWGGAWKTNQFDQMKLTADFGTDAYSSTSTISIFWHSSWNTSVG